MSGRAQHRWFHCFQSVWFTSDGAPEHDVVAHGSNRAALSVGTFVY